jgi:hypothetical protein
MQQARKLKTGTAMQRKSANDMLMRAKACTRLKKMGPTWRRIASESHCPKAVAVGVRGKEGLRSLYTRKLGYGMNPGEVYEVTCGIHEEGGEKIGEIDGAGLASIYHAVMNLGARAVEIWVDGVDMKSVARAIRMVVGKKAEIRMSPFSALDAHMESSGYLGWGEPSVEEMDTVASAPGARLWERGMPQGGEAEAPRDFMDISGADAVVLTESDTYLFPHEFFGKNIIPVSNGGLFLSPVAIRVMIEAVEGGTGNIVVFGTGRDENGKITDTAIGTKRLKRKFAEGLDPSEIRGGKKDVGSIVGILKGEKRGGRILPELTKLRQLIAEKGVEVVGAVLDIASGEVREVG